jgi:hypothetical protein
VATIISLGGEGEVAGEVNLNLLTLTRRSVAHIVRSVENGQGWLVRGDICAALPVDVC